jgi:hypothetical protein
VHGYDFAVIHPCDQHVRRCVALLLDLGARTGALSAAVLGGLPRTRVTLLDVDAEMLDEARRRLAPFAERVRFREASFSILFPQPTPRSPRWRSTTSMTSTPRPISTTRSMKRWFREVCSSTSTRRSPTARASTR